MIVQLELWHLMALLLAFFGAVWAFGTTLLKQVDKRLDERFKTQETQRTEAQALWSQRFKELEDASHSREREHLTLQAEMERNFVRRDDHIRYETSLNGKCDALNAKMDLMNERLLRADT